MRKILLALLLAASPLLIPQSASAAGQEEKTSTQYYPVGELGEQWVLPSDHLPVGGSVGNVHFVMWNILYTNALHYIADNTQGLKDSFIMAANVPMDDGLTLRETVVIDQVFEMIEHPTHPRSLLALEETSEEVYNHLKSTLPNNFRMYPNNVKDIAHGDIFLYDTNLFDFVSFQSLRYKCNRSNTYMTLTLKEKTSGLTYRFVQSHVPGGPASNSRPAREELANALMNDFNPKAITIVMGDMNRSADYFLDNFKRAAAEKGMKQPFKHLPVPYATHINTHREASWIDNIFISNPYPQYLDSYVAEDASVLFADLQRTIDLLESLRPVRHNIPHMAE